MSGLPRFKTPEELDKSFKDIHTLSGHFNSSYLSKQFPSSSSIYPFNDTHSVQNVKENIKDLRNLTNAYHKNITYATGLCLVNQHIFIASSHGIQTNLKVSKWWCGI